MIYRCPDCHIQLIEGVETSIQGPDNMDTETQKCWQCPRCLIDYFEDEISDLEQDE